MKLKHLLTKFLRSERGAVTVEWIVLTAGVVGLALALSDSLKNGLTGMAANIGTYLTEFEVGTSTPASP